MPSGGSLPARCVLNRHLRAVPATAAGPKSLAVVSQESAMPLMVLASHDTLALPVCADHHWVRS